jgi:hypothetical protein
MLTMFGAVLVNVAQAYACAKGQGPVEVGAGNPPVAGSDKRAPTPPVITG